MTQPFQKVMKLAHKTFSKLNTNRTLDSDHLATLAASLSKIRAHDINFDRTIGSPKRENNDRHPKFQEAPVTYIRIWDDNVMSAGVFVMKKGARLPLHDHPGMYGLCKVIHGKMKVESFSLLNGHPNENPSGFDGRSSLKPVQQNANVILTEEDDCCVLSPEAGNIHEISSVDGSAAFLDILAPPYDYKNMTRTCQYYQVQSEKSQEKSSVKWLMEIPDPDDYWCDTAPYQGPPLNIHL